MGQQLTDARAVQVLPKAAELLHQGLSECAASTLM
jgi:hypothetical protein